MFKGDLHMSRPLRLPLLGRYHQKPFYYWGGLQAIRVNTN